MGPSLTHLASGAHSTPARKPSSFRQVGQSHQCPHEFCAALAQIPYPSIPEETVSMALAPLSGKWDSQRSCLGCYLCPSSLHLWDESSVHRTVQG